MPQFYLNFENMKILDLLILCIFISNRHFEIKAILWLLESKIML